MLKLAGDQTKVILNITLRFFCGIRSNLYDRMVRVKYK